MMGFAGGFKQIYEFFSICFFKEEILGFGFYFLDLFELMVGFEKKTIFSKPRNLGK